MNFTEMNPIPDPLELTDDRIERMIEEQAGAPEGSFVCPGCRKIFSYEPMTTSAAPDAPISCYDCLGPELQNAYDRFELSLAERSE